MGAEQGDGQGDGQADGQADGQGGAGAGFWRAWVPWSPVVLLALLYGPALPGSGWILDDAILLRDHLHPGRWIGDWTQPTYLHAAGRASYVWRPLTATLWQVWGAVLREPWWFRLLNLLLMGGVLLALGRLARRQGAPGERAGAGAEAGAWLGLLLLLHPATVEVVCWPSAAFDLSAALLLLRGAEAGLAGRGGRAALWFLGACFCKETALAGALPLMWAVRGARSGRAWSGRAWSGGAWSGGAWFGRALIAGAGLFWIGLHWLMVGPGGSAGWESAAAWAQGWGLLLWPSGAPVSRMLVLWWPVGEMVWTQLGPLLAGLAAAGGLVWACGRAGGAGGAWAGARAAGAAALMLLPVGAGAPIIGMLPSRWLFLPVVAALGALGALRIGRPAAGAALAVALIVWGPWLRRIPAWQSEARLWEAERAAEPMNPYAMRQQARSAWDVAGLEERRALLGQWRQSVRMLEGRPLGVFDIVEERYQLAQGAFLAGEYGMAAEEIRIFFDMKRRRGEPVPANAWCLLADSLERTGGDSEEIGAAAVRCR